MALDVTAVVGTFGAPEWERIARRAVASAEAEGVPVINVHAATLHDARNEALAQVETEWVIHLDADDELTPGYVEAMAAAEADIRAPSVSYVRPHRAPRPPGMPNVAGHHHACRGDCLPDGNWIVVGAAVRTELVLRVGGWRDFPCYEDWDLWLRCWLAGATVEAVPAAVYRAHVRFDSRNRAPNIAAKNLVHRQIVAANLPAAA